MSNDYTTVLEPQRRGGEFRYSFTLGNGWVWTNFAEMKFTLRTVAPSSSSTSDADAVDQASLGTGELTFSTTTTGTILITGARTATWPARHLLWDLEGFVTTGARALPIDSGRLLVTPDMTRTPWV